MTRWKWYFTATGESEESFFHLLLCVMGKAADLRDFDRGQIVMARRLGTSISEIARLVGCSRPTVVSTYAKWMNDGETSSRRHGVGRPHAFQRKRSSETVSHGEAKPEPDSGSADSPIQCRAK